MPNDALFTPIDMGAIHLKNRIVMPPLTRSRADVQGVPSVHAADYYADRAEGAGLVIAEATQVSFGAQGYPRTPGAHTAEQMDAWKRIVDAVHARNGKIAIQLWHVGRVTHHLNRRPGTEAVGPSAIAARGQMYTDQAGLQPFDEPRPLTETEIAAIAADFASTAGRAIDAGFDAVEIHSANGYLLHQFLSTNANKRTDRYGGSIENRMRMPLEVVDAVVARIGANRTGIRISPGHAFNDITEDDMAVLYPRYITELSRYGLAYLHVMRPVANTLDTDVVAMARKAWKGPLIACGGYTADTGAALVAAKGADAIGFGQAFIANPDLPQRLRANATLNAPDQATFYTPGPKGYTDYPMLATA